MLGAFLINVSIVTLETAGTQQQAESQAESQEGLIATVNGGDDGTIVNVTAINGSTLDNQTARGTATEAVINNGSSSGNNVSITIGVSIVSGASILTDTAFQPNPVNVSVLVGTVIWANEDLVPHTVTSGENGEPDGKFDSSIIGPEETFSFTFTEAGAYSYFCILHPNMVGTVNVMS